MEGIRYRELLTQKMGELRSLGGDVKQLGAGQQQDAAGTTQRDRGIRRKVLIRSQLPGRAGPSQETKQTNPPSKQKREEEMEKHPGFSFLPTFQSPISAPTGRN